MTPAQQREEISKAYVHAIAAHLGFNVGVYAQDDDCIDCTVRCSGLISSESKLAAAGIFLQLKATTAARWVDGGLNFQLKRAHYEILRQDFPLPVYLVVIDLGNPLSAAIKWAPDGVQIRHCAYWLAACELKNFTFPTGQDSATVTLSRAHVFSPEALHAMVVAASCLEQVKWPSS